VKWITLGFAAAGQQMALPCMGTFVADYTGKLYIRHEGWGWHHSSFLSGEPVLAAGLICIRQGVIRVVTPESGHYQPSVENMRRFAVLHAANLGSCAIMPDPANEVFYKVSDFIANRMTPATQVSQQKLNRLLSAAGPVPIP
jgi:hypothetical protein